MMKKKLFVLLTVVCILALATACGSQTSGTDTDSNAGTQSGAQQKESTLTGKLDEHCRCRCALSGTGKAAAGRRL